MVRAHRTNMVGDITNPPLNQKVAAGMKPDIVQVIFRLLDATTVPAIVLKLRFPLCNATVGRKVYKEFYSNNHRN